MNYAIEKQIHPTINIHDLVTTGVQRGFFSAQTAPSSTSTLLEKMVDLLAEEFRTAAAKKSLFPLTRIGQLFWIDSAHSFDPGYVAQLSAVHGMNPQRILRTIHVNQVYTQSQLYNAVRAVPRTQVWFSYQQSTPPHHPLPSFGEGGGRPAYASSKAASAGEPTSIKPMVGKPAPDSRSVIRGLGKLFGREVPQPRFDSKVSRIQYLPLVVISDLFGLFLKTSGDGRREVLLQEFMWQVSTLARNAIVVALVSKESLDYQPSLSSFLSHYTQPVDLKNLRHTQQIAASA